VSIYVVKAEKRSGYGKWFWVVEEALPLRQMDEW
jgi:hypothetical protein